MSWEPPAEELLFLLIPTSSSLECGITNNTAEDSCRNNDLHTIEDWEKLCPPKEIFPYFLVKCYLLLLAAETFEDANDPGDKASGETDNF